MTGRGVFAVARAIWDDPDFPDEPFTEREAFLWLVGEAAWRPTKVRVGKTVVSVGRGQCSFSTRFMASKWRWTEARVRRFLVRLEKRNSITRKIDAGSTQITICNYNRFQRVSLPSDAPSTQERRKEEDREYKEDIENPQVVAGAPACEDEPDLNDLEVVEKQARILVGAEPCAAAHDFHRIRHLIGTDHITGADVIAGIRVGLDNADRHFRFRWWRQFEGWIRGATSDRLAATARRPRGGAPPPQDDAADRPRFANKTVNAAANLIRRLQEQEEANGQYRPE